MPSKLKKERADDMKASVVDDVSEEVVDTTDPNESKQGKKAKDSKTPAEQDYTKLARQCGDEFTIGYQFIKPKWDKWGVRLRLYNNQRRDEESVGDPLLFTIHQTVLASLYDDKLATAFEAREEGDQDLSENLAGLSEFDYEEMEKDILDYEWDWDATFFGRGLVLLNEFDRDCLTPIPEVIDPMTFIRDPDAKSVNGNRQRKGQARFLGWETRMTMTELKNNPAYFNLDKLEKDDTRSEVDDNVQARKDAQGFNDQRLGNSLKGDNASYRITVWFTHWKGKKVVVHLANNRKQVIRFQTIKEKTWPIIDRVIYPISHDWDGVSIPDLVEDKQRARAIAQNLSLAVAKAGLYPTYLYDATKILNKSDLTLEFNKFIGVDGNPQGAVAEIQRSNVKQDVQWIMDVLDTGAQKATATPEIQQGATSAQRRTATEINLVTQKVDTRYSLSAKIFGWSEKRFWKRWYQIYKEHLDAKIDEKVVRIMGSQGSTWKKLRAKDIIMGTDPDVQITSKVLSEAMRINKLQAFSNYSTLIAQEPTANKRYVYKHLGKLNGLKEDELKLVFPPTIDEMDAEMENEQLSKDKLQAVDIKDDDIQHIEVHAKAGDTPAKYAHIEAHKRAMRLKKLRPDLAAPTVNAAGTVDATGKPNLNYAPVPAGNIGVNPSPKPGMA